MSAAVALAVVSSLALPAVAAAGTSTTGSTAPASRWVRSSGSVPLLPQGSRAIGSLPGSRVLDVDVVLRPRDQSGLDAFAQAASTPGSSMFRQYLAPGRFAATFGPAASTVAAVRTWLSGVGLRVGPTSSDALIVPVEGSAAAMERAFDVSFEQYRLPSGRVARLPTEEPLVPGDLESDLTGVVGLDDLAQPVPQLVRGTGAGAAWGQGTLRFVPAGSSTSPTGARPEISPEVAGPQADCAAMGSAGLSATQLAQAYSFSALYGSGDEGQGTTIGVYSLEPYTPSDITTYEGCYSPAITAQVTPVSVDGAAPTEPGGNSEQSGESALDIEMAVGMAPQVSVDVYVGSDNGVGASNTQALDTYAAMVDQDSVRVISTSWGECERDLGAAQIEAEASLFAQAAAQGQTITAAGGDSGSEDCFGDGTSNDQVLAVDDPASQPWVTSVGGTALESLGPPPVEAVWDNGFGAGGGGISQLWTMPAWQVGPGVQNKFTSVSACSISSGTGTSSCREVPDVSADADPSSSAAAEYFGGQWTGVGGTSMGSPLMAALAALADEGQAQPVGLMDPTLYVAGCLASPPFDDITSGNNQPPAPDLPTNSNGVTLTGGPFYPATAHYDLASGLGSPIASELVQDLRTPPSPSSCGSKPPNCNSTSASDAASASGSGAGTPAAPIAPSPAAVSTSGLGFTPLSSPVRIADTRLGAGDPSTYAGDTLCAGGSLTI
ncbi:MAG TPA: S53 family peptidase, partial [Acidimicrobiales bacterium]|nr:S53 family peptidase [Acidimicrobiales bacterium]